MKHVYSMVSLYALVALASCGMITGAQQKSVPKAPQKHQSRNITVIHPVDLFGKTTSCRMKYSDLTTTIMSYAKKNEHKTSQAVSLIEVAEQYKKVFDAAATFVACAEKHIEKNCHPCPLSKQVLTCTRSQHSVCSTDDCGCTICHCVSKK